MPDFRVIDGGGKGNRDKDGAERDLREKLLEAAANMLRIIRGAGKPDELIVQVNEFLLAAIRYKDKVGRWPSGEVFAEILAIKRDADEIRVEDRTEEDRDRMYESGRMDRMYAEQTIKAGVLRTIAAQLLGQDLQERHGKKELSDGIDQAIRADAKSEKYWKAKNSPLVKGPSKKAPTRRFGSKLGKPSRDNEPI
jgi:hypothetical protein